MGSRNQDFTPTEGRLKTELTHAREAYERAKIEFDEATRHAHSIGLDNPDGAHALHVAAKEYGHTLSRYSEAVQRFTDFLLRGKQS